MGGGTGDGGWGGTGDRTGLGGGGLEIVGRLEEGGEGKWRWEVVRVWVQWGLAMVGWRVCGGGGEGELGGGGGEAGQTGDVWGVGREGEG